MNIEDFINGNSSTEIDKLTTALGAAAEMLFIFMREYAFPKKWLKVRAPKELSDEQRENMAKRARERFWFAKEGDNYGGGNNSEQE